MNSEFQYVQAAAVSRRFDESATRWAVCSKKWLVNALLEVDHAEAVDDRPRRVAVDDAAHAEVADVEADPQDDLEAEVPPAARENPASCCDDSSHRLILIRRAGVTNHPPM